MAVVADRVVPGDRVAPEHRPEVPDCIQVVSVPVLVALVPIPGFAGRYRPPGECSGYT